MTDEQIIKALECCTKDCVKDCDYCPYDIKETETYCANDLIKDALDLINRQKAEIERLQRAYDVYEETTGLKRAKFEAINTYHEEVKKRCIESGIYPVIIKKIMEDVRKEMT